MTMPTNNRSVSRARIVRLQGERKDVVGYEDNEIFKGEVQERLNCLVSKTMGDASLTRVQISPSPLN